MRSLTGTSAPLILTFAPALSLPLTRPFTVTVDVVTVVPSRGVSTFAPYSPSPAEGWGKNEARKQVSQPSFLRASRRSKFSADGWRSITPPDRSPRHGKISTSVGNEVQYRTRYWNAICASKPGKGIDAAKINAIGQGKHMAGLVYQKFYSFFSIEFPGPLFSSSPHKRPGRNGQS